jgi:hypothetical protein
VLHVHVEVRGRRAGGSGADDLGLRVDGVALRAVREHGIILRRMVSKSDAFRNAKRRNGRRTLPINTSSQLNYDGAISQISPPVTGPSVGELRHHLGLSSRKTQDKELTRMYRFVKTRVLALPLLRLCDC